jgi:glycyl-tRNA synthetase
MTSDVTLTAVKYYVLRRGGSANFMDAAGAAKSCSSTAAGGGIPAVRAPSAPAAVPAPPCPGGEAAPSLDGGGERFGKTSKELTELCRRRFFFRPSCELYGGVAGLFTYGPPGCAVKNNLIRQWRQHFVIEENLLEVEDTCIMQHQVLKASGHVDRFNDFMVKDVEDESKFFRADKLLEEVMDAKMEAAGVTEEQKKEYTAVRNQADAFSKAELYAVFQKYGIKSPETGNDLSEPYEFNLMFPTPIGPGGYLQGYLRPETAQGIFLNYKFCCEQNSNRLPFGVAQVGRAFRNEIAPRAGLTRQREFTQAEIEFFVNPSNMTHPKFNSPDIAGTVLSLFHSQEQLAAKDPVRMSMGDAVRSGKVHNEFLGYTIVRTYLFLTSVGVEKEHIRFRQHLPTEMAHYARDCWDAEIYTSYGWLECVGIADRAAFDLNAHSKAARCDLQFKESLEKPIEQEVLSITKASGITVMKAFKKDGKAVKEWIEALSQCDLQELQADLQKGPKEVEVDGKTFTLTPEQVIFEKKKEKITVNAFTPGVIEPSFGIDRIFTAVLEHVYYARPKDEESDDKQTRGVLKFAGAMAPYKCVILPLDQRIARDEKYTELLNSFRGEMSSLGLSFTMDESGATIGRRYARNDELGVPLAMTLDFDTMKDSTVTLRERDSMEQMRLPIAKVPELVRKFCTGECTWEVARSSVG